MEPATAGDYGAETTGETSPSDTPHTLGKNGLHHQPFPAKNGGDLSAQLSHEHLCGRIIIHDERRESDHDEKIPARLANVEFPSLNLSAQATKYYFQFSNDNL